MFADIYGIINFASDEMPRNVSACHAEVNAAEAVTGDHEASTRHNVTVNSSVECAGAGHPNTAPTAGRDHGRKAWALEICNMGPLLLIQRLEAAAQQTAAFSWLPRHKSPPSMSSMVDDDVGSPPPSAPELKVEGSNVTVTRGFEIKDHLRARGFRFDPSSRMWCASVSAVLALLGASDVGNISLEVMKASQE